MSKTAFLPVAPVGAAPAGRLTYSRSSTSRSRGLRLTVRCTRTRSSSAPPAVPTNPTSSSSQLPPHPFPSKTASVFLLNVVTVLWGTQHSVIKLAIDSDFSSPASLNFARFLLAALVSAPFLPSLPRLRGPLPSVWARGLEQAGWMFAGYAAQAVALQTTTAARSGFLLYLNVKLVPLLARVLYGRRITPSVWASAGLALAGTVLLTYDGAPPVIGDLWSVAAAAASAMFIVRMERAATTAKPAAVSAVALLGVAGFSGLWAAFSGVLAAPGLSGVELVKHVTSGLVPGSPEVLAGVLYLGLVTTALSNYLQTLGQRRIPAERAAVLYALDPVYGAMFAYLLLGESLGPQGIVGAALVTLAAIWSNQSDQTTSGANKVEETDPEKGELLNEAVGFDASSVLGEDAASSRRRGASEGGLDVDGTSGV